MKGVRVVRVWRRRKDEVGGGREEEVRLGEAGVEARRRRDEERGRRG